MDSRIIFNIENMESKVENKENVSHNSNVNEIKMNKNRNKNVLERNKNDDLQIVVKKKKQKEKRRIENVDITKKQDLANMSTSTLIGITNTTSLNNNNIINNANNNLNNINNVSDHLIIVNTNSHRNHSTTIRKNINDGSFYIDKENKILILQYGTDVYNYDRNLENESIPYNFILRHKLNPEIRTKMVDWMIEVLSVYKSEIETLFLSVHIMDMFLSFSKYPVRSEDIHLIGMTSMLTASKFEDVIPIRMQSMVEKIGHKLFDEREIKIKERLIIDTIDFDNLITTSIYEFIKTYFFDFTFNNKDTIRNLKLTTIIEILKTTSIYLGKLILHFELFYKYKHSLKAISCLIAAFDLVRTNSKFLVEDGEKFIREWIMFLIQESSFSAELIGDVYSKIVEHYLKYEKIYFIGQNLNKYSPLNFN